jgi:4-hydroxy-tetrahydrodipicolinate synthase
MNTKFIGTGVAIVTPFNEDRTVDYKSLEKLIEHLIAGNTDYLVVQGTTGESVTLTKEEKIAIIDFVVEINKGRVPIVLGMGGNNTLSILKDIETFDFTGIDAILSVSPYYNKPTQEGIYQHYMAIAKASPVPVILYNVPGRTGSNISAETTLKLAYDSKNIIAIKEAATDYAQIMKIIKNRPEHFLLISGDDALTLPTIASGGNGVISVVANAFPKEFSEMVGYCLDNDYENARVLHYRLVSFIDMLFAEGNPGGIKAALKMLGITNDYMRLPLVNISNTLYSKMEKEITMIKSLS